MTTPKHAGGRPSTKVKCPNCGGDFTLTQMRKHLGACIKKTNWVTQQTHDFLQKEEEKPQ